MRVPPPTSAVKATLTASLVVVIAFLTHNPALAQPRPKVSSTSMRLPHGEALHVTLRTQEGIERFVFGQASATSAEGDETDYRGFARPRNFQRDELPAAMTITKNRAWIFYTSRRTGRPAAASISIGASAGTLNTRALRISRVPKGKLACGSHAGDDDNTPETAHAESTRRKNISAHAPITALGVKPFSPARILEVATEADPEFYDVYGEDTNAYIRAVLNAVDVIYTSSLGIKIKVTTQRLTKTTSGRRGPIEASRLLEAFRKSSFGSSAAGDIRHLFTGRDIDGLTIGIAYVGAVCTVEGRYGVGLSYAVRPGLAPFLAAHEIAHNLSATHDMQSRSIMNPAITEANSRFTEHALADMRDFVATTGGCLASEELSTPKTRVTSSEASKFATQVSFFTSKPRTCSVTLYGSSDGRRYVALASEYARSSGQTGAGVATFSADTPKLATPQTFYFKAKVACGRTQTTSAATKVRYGSPSSATASLGNANRWLESLKQNLNDR